MVDSARHVVFGATSRTFAMSLYGTKQITTEYPQIYLTRDINEGEYQILVQQ